MKKSAKAKHKILLFRLVASSAIALLAFTLFIGNMLGWLSISNITNIDGTELGTVEIDKSIGSLEIYIDGEIVEGNIEFVLLPGEYKVLKLKIKNTTSLSMDYNLLLENFKIEYDVNKYTEKIIKNGMYTKNGAFFDDSTFNVDAFKKFVAPMINAVHFGIYDFNPVLNQTLIYNTNELRETLSLLYKVMGVDELNTADGDFASGKTYEVTENPLDIISSDKSKSTTITVEPGDEFAKEVFVVLYFDETKTTKGSGSYTPSAEGASPVDLSEVELNNSNGYIGQTMTISFTLGTPKSNETNP